MPETFSLTVVRPEDMVVLVLEFRDVGLVKPKAGAPARVTGTAGALLVVHFQPQHVAEEAYFQTAGPGVGDPPGGEPPAPPGAVRSRLAGPSRLAFTIPAGRTIDLTLAALLAALEELPLRVTPVSAFEPSAGGCAFLGSRLGQAPPRVTKPLEPETAIEVPYRLVLSPGGFAAWSHQALPVEHAGRTELWHTRLGRTPAGDPGVRAVWSPDFRSDSLQPSFTPPAPTPDDAFRSSLDARVRNEIVHLTSNYHLGVDPAPVATERMMLSPLGAWLRVQGDWTLPVQKVGGLGLTVEQWRHDAVMGRDQYVRVVEGGYLMPFGHRASLVTVTERKLARPEGSPALVAYLFQRMYIVVREPRREYAQRAFPFRAVTFHTLVTPDLAEPAESDLRGQGKAAFWPRIRTGEGGTVLFNFHLSAADWAGRLSEFIAPLVFVRHDVAGAPVLGAVVDDYNHDEAAGEPTPRVRNFGGQAVAFAPQVEEGDTSFAAGSLTLRAVVAPDGTPPFLPEMESASIGIPTVEAITGSPAASRIVWGDAYLAEGFGGGNLGQVFAKVANDGGSQTALDFGSADRAGGLVTPSMDVTGLSRSLGPTSGPVQKMAAGTFEPKDVFPSVTLFGAIDLMSIVRPMINYDLNDPKARVPALTTAVEGAEVVTAYRWELEKEHLAEASVKAQAGPPAVIPTGVPLFKPLDGATFSLLSELRQRTDGSGSSRTVRGRLANFSVTLLPVQDLQLVEIDFEHVDFTAVDGRKPDVTVRLGEIRFCGPLEFVNELQRYIPLGGFEDPPNLDVVLSPNPGLNVGFTLGIPTMGVGVMTMQNVSLSAGFFLPFMDAELNFRFAFCERHQPFILTVSGLGGGGFFGIDVGLHGVVRVEAALEFGASVALNLGVASGQVTVMGGFYFQMAGSAVQLTAYVRAAGAMSVLGIVTVCVEFYLGLTFQPKSGSGTLSRLWGEASLTVKVKILFFSKKVSVHLEREFAGSDPTFRTLVPLQAWADHCAAFADYP
ncbi:MAG TPA: hypothetical protein VM890_03270 [Longimicrobium sp.]|nr:hypothetical protein [Longimicrobium sp.]